MKMDWQARRKKQIDDARPHPIGFAAMLRIRNEARWIAEVIESILPLCPHIFIMDDHSTDDTVAICRRFEQVLVFASPFEGLDEARDKNWLYDRVMEHCCPEWILCIDGDEVLEKRGPAALKRICKEGSADAYRLKIIFLWNDRYTVRVDRIYDFFYRPSIFRPFYASPLNPDEVKLSGEFRWLSTPFGRVKAGEKPNLHCSSVPQRRIHAAPNIEVRLLHLGYMLREDRVKKLDYYTSIDWNDKAEDCYRHMTQGDHVRLKELPRTQQLLLGGKISRADVEYMLTNPPEARLIHAGPIELAPFVE